MSAQNSTVLVTGGSGFVGGHCILQLAAAGYRVRATVRSLDRVAGVREQLAAAGLSPDADLAFVAADLTSDPGWADAVAGVDYVLHVASPFPLESPKHEDELIIPAREGALRVLRAASAAGVKRVVLTSSFAAIGYGKPPTGVEYTEEDWSDITGEISAYAKSKTLAERAAWDFVAGLSSPADSPPAVPATGAVSLAPLELAVVNPVGIFGPALGPDYSTSIILVKRLLDGAVPGLPHLSYGVVDVRDVASLHLLAMTSPKAAGERFLAVSGTPMTMQQIAEVLRSRLGAAASKVPTRVLPSWAVRLFALVSPSLRPLTPELDKPKRISGEKAKAVLGWAPRSPEDAIAASGESVVGLAG